MPALLAALLPATPAHASRHRLEAIVSLSPALVLPGQPQHPPKLVDLGVVARVLHAVHPSHLLVLEQHLAANLSEIAALHYTFPAFDALDHALHRGRHHSRPDIFRALRSHRQRARHAQLRIQLGGRVGEDGEGAVGRLRIHGNQLGAAAADDGDEGRRGQREQRVRGDAGGEGAQEFLAVLLQC